MYYDDKDLELGVEYSLNQSFKKLLAMNIMLYIIYANINGLPVPFFN